jgi:hypothetical protein
LLAECGLQRPHNGHDLSPGAFDKTWPVPATSLIRFALPGQTVRNQAAQSQTRDMDQAATGRESQGQEAPDFVVGKAVMDVWDQLDANA